MFNTVSVVGSGPLGCRIALACAVEGMPVALVRASRGDLDAIRRAHQDSFAFVETGDALSYYKANIAFHEAIYRASHNGTLIKMTISIHNRVAPYRRLQLEQVDRIRLSHEEHEKLIRAIEAGQGDEADRIAQAHILNTSLDVRRLLSILSDRPESEEGEIMTEGISLGLENGAANSRGLGGRG